MAGLRRSSVVAAGRLLPLLTGLRDTLGIRAVHYLGAARLLAVAVAGWSGLLALSAPGGSWEPKLPDPTSGPDLRLVVRFSLITQLLVVSGSGAVPDPA